MDNSTEAGGPQDSDRTIAVRTSYAWRRFLRRGKVLVGSDPALLGLFLRLTPLGLSRKLTEHTDLVIEGFPRSSNTYAAFAIGDACAHRLTIASHAHHPAQVMRAAELGIPTMFVIRQPLDTLTSYLVQGPHARPGEVIKEWVGYHRTLVPYADRVLVADFTQVTNEINVVIERLRQRFDLEIPPFDDSSENVDRVMDDLATQHRLVEPEQDPIRVVPHPKAEREDLKNRTRAALLAPAHAKGMGQAEDLYRFFAGKAGVKVGTTLQSAD